METDFLFQRLHTLTQFSTVEFYGQQFQLLQSLVAARYPDLQEAYYISCCINGLKAEIKKVMQFYQPLTVKHALRLATFQEEILAEQAEVIIEDLITEPTLPAEGRRSDIREEILDNEVGDVEPVVSPNVVYTMEDDRLHDEEHVASLSITSVVEVEQLAKEYAVGHVNNEVKSGAEVIPSIEYSVSLCTDFAEVLQCTRVVNMVNEVAGVSTRALDDVSDFSWEPGPDPLVSTAGAAIPIHSVCRVNVNLQSEQTSALLVLRVDRDNTKVGEAAFAGTEGSVVTRASIQDTLHVQYKSYAENSVVDVVSRVISMASLYFTVDIIASEKERNSSFCWEPGPLSSRFKVKNLCCDKFTFNIAINVPALGRLLVKDYMGVMGLQNNSPFHFSADTVRHEQFEGVFDPGGSLMLPLFYYPAVSIWRLLHM